jgi:hypothetical protein
MVWGDDGKGIREHHKVIMEATGRNIEIGEEVHHINGVKDDNRLENLVILTRSQHASTHGNLSSGAVSFCRWLYECFQGSDGVSLDAIEQKLTESCPQLLPSFYEQFRES